MNKFKVSYTQDNNIYYKTVRAESMMIDHNGNLLLLNANNEAVAIFNYYNNVLKIGSEEKNDG